MEPPESALVGVSPSFVTTVQDCTDAIAAIGAVLTAVDRDPFLDKVTFATKGPKDKRQSLLDKAEGAQAQLDKGNFPKALKKVQDIKDKVDAWDAPPPKDKIFDGKAEGDGVTELKDKIQTAIECLEALIAL